MVLSLARDLQHFWDLLFILPTITEAVGPLGMRLDLFGKPGLVALFVVPPRFPLAGVVAELGLIHHSDALFHWAYRFADTAAATGLHVCVIQTLRSYVEAGVRTVQPAQSALDASVEVHHRPHGSGAELLEGRVAVGLKSAVDVGHRIFHVPSGRNAGNGDAFAHFVPLRKIKFVGNFGIALISPNRSSADALIGPRRGFSLDGILPLIHDHFLHRFQTEQVGYDLGDRPENAYV